MLIILASLLVFTLSSNLYATLGISPRSSDAQIKKAFKQMSLKHHPDRSEDPNASAKYQEIVNAYQILKDPHKKQQYDLTGSTNPNERMNGHGHRQYHFQNQHFDPFGGFEQIFRQFQQQAHSQRRQNFQHQRRQQQHQNQEYQYMQYIDEFGRIRTVMVKKGGRSEGGAIPDNVMEALMVPVQMILIFVIGYIIVSMFSAEEKEKRKQPNQPNKEQEKKNQ